ncbi:hypothetical protein SSP531S_02880 [Streptomyces spongiicola]|uniref:Uncharacterized protein n=1 Tax=Streptomyces spongiicola TaxID=1690221 RepID=A0A388SR44_9ACTN|nr:hypothetical protein SSP531S_02880 [Streptomyces spongiicola]
MAGTEVAGTEVSRSEEPGRAMSWRGPWYRRVRRLPGSELPGWEETTAHDAARDESAGAGRRDVVCGVCAAMNADAHIDANTNTDTKANAKANTDTDTNTNTNTNAHINAHMNADADTTGDRSRAVRGMGTARTGPGRLVAGGHRTGDGTRSVTGGLVDGRGGRR